MAPSPLPGPPGVASHPSSLRFSPAQPPAADALAVPPPMNDFCPPTFPFSGAGPAAPPLPVPFFQTPPSAAASSNLAAMEAVSRDEPTFPFSAPRTSPDPFVAGGSFLDLMARVSTSDEFLNSSYSAQAHGVARQGLSASLEADYPPDLNINCSPDCNFEPCANRVMEHLQTSYSDGSEYVEDDGDDERSDEEDNGSYDSESNGNHGISVGYCSSRDVPCVRTIDEVNEDGGNNGQLITEDIAVKKIEQWGKMSPLSANESIMSAIEYAMRNSGRQEHMFLPKVGQTFPSLGDAYQFYNLYSWEVGFSIRKGNNQNRANFLTEDGQRLKIMQEFRCQRAGEPGKDARSSTKCGCKARMRLLRNKEDEWYITIFEPKHNHELVTSCAEKQHLFSHQSIDQSTKNMIRYLRENNVSLSKVNCIAGSIAGSVNNLTFTKSRLKTLCSDIALEMIADDMEKTILSFMKMREDDPNFVFGFQLDKDLRLISLMWSSGNSRKMYSDFGDVVTFDTTFNTNLYKMPFGMFVGVNNHFQSVIFAGVLLTREDIASFKWAFSTFVEMMGGKAPMTILTDQCAAMAAAIREVLKGTAHGWCKWHVMKKVVETLGHMFSKKDFDDDFNKVVNHMYSKQEFEDAWNAMLDKYNLRGHPELTRAFQSRKLWAKAWFTNIYCARMTSTQRSESANHVLKNLVPPKSPLNQFVLQYTKIVHGQEKAFAGKEKDTNQRHIKAKYGWPIEAHAIRIYTQSAYKLFLKELDRSTSYIVNQRMTEDPNVYTVVHVESAKRDRWSKVSFKVQVEGDAEVYSCECGLYNHFGILCCHALIVMVQRGVLEIPEAHIMKRWTRGACAENPTHLVPAVQSSNMMDSRHFRSNVLDATWKEVMELANVDRDCFDMAVTQLTSLLKNLKLARETTRTHCQVGYASSCSEWEGSRGMTSGAEMFSDREGRPIRIIDSTSGAAINLSSIKPPIIKRSMGRTSNTRFKGSKDIRISRLKVRKARNRRKASGAVKQSKFCSRCGSASHDVRKCNETVEGADEDGVSWDEA